MNLFARYLRWDPAPFLKISMLFLSIAIAATLWRPAMWPWLAGAAACIHVVLTTAGLWPRSRILGPNLVTLPLAAARRGEVAITIDDGPDPHVTPRVLDILDRYNARATFFCIGALAERHPDLCRDIVRRGHAVENHSQHHSVLFSLFGPRRIYREVQHSQAALRGIIGHAPRFFRPTAGLRNVFLYPVLARAGLTLVTWSKRGFDTRETNPDIVLKRLLHGLKAGDVLLLHDGNAARTPSGAPVILDVLPRLLDHLAQARLHPVTLRSALP